MKDDRSVIFHSNLLRNSKWLGMIDYKSLIVLIIYIFCIFNIVKIININFEYKLYLNMFLIIPVVAITICNIDNESVYEVIKIVIGYNIKPKLYTYNFNNKDQNELNIKL